MARTKVAPKKLTYSLAEAKAVTGWNRSYIWREVKNGLLLRVRYPHNNRLYIDAASIEALYQQGKAAGING